MAVRTSSTKVTWLLQVLITVPNLAVLLKIFVLLISIYIELAIRAITPPLLVALLKSKMDSSMLTKLFHHHQQHYH